MDEMKRPADRFGAGQDHPRAMMEQKGTDPGANTKPYPPPLQATRPVENIFSRIHRERAEGDQSIERANAAYRLSEFATDNPRLLQAIADLQTLGIIPRNY